MPPEEIEAKFRANARLALSEGQLDLIVKSVKTLEQLPSITTLTDQLIGHDPEQKNSLGGNEHEKESLLFVVHVFGCHRLLLPSPKMPR